MFDDLKDPNKNPLAVIISARGVAAQEAFTLAPKAIEEPGSDPLKRIHSRKHGVKHSSIETHVGRAVSESTSPAKDMLTKVEPYKKREGHQTRYRSLTPAQVYRVLLATTCAEEPAILHNINVEPKL